MPAGRGLLFPAPGQGEPCTVPEFPRGRPPLCPPTSGPVSPRSWHGPISHAHLSSLRDSHLVLLSLLCAASLLCGLSRFLCWWPSGFPLGWPRKTAAAGCWPACVRVSAVWAGDERTESGAWIPQSGFLTWLRRWASPCREGRSSVPWWLRSALTLSASPWARVRSGGGEFLTGGGSKRAHTASTRLSLLPRDPCWGWRWRVV